MNGRIFRLSACALFLLLMGVFFVRPAHAWFIFIPGALTEKIVNGLKGVDADMCVPPAAQEGTVINSPSGSTALIKTISGPSSRCKNPLHPVLASVVYKDVFATKAGLTIPEGYEQVYIPPDHRFQGQALVLEHRQEDVKLFMFSRKRSEKFSAEDAARVTGAGLTGAMVDAKIYDEEKLNVGGVPVLRFIASGKSQGVFAKSYKLLVTVFDAEEEILTVNVRAPAEAFDRRLDEFKKIVGSVTGISPRVVASVKKESAPQAALVSDSQAKEGGVKVVEEGGSSSQKPSSPPPVSAPLPPKQSAVESEGERTEKPSQPASSEVSAKLRELQKLYQDGVITRDEYEGKKKELLSKF